ncbi:SH3 domain-containing protein [Candidatus Bathyarchaeota archaeon]|nr:SH3 domain-containing protein [Candidatus Bathyarchaeota archaeon]
MEKGLLDDGDYENIVNLLPDETPLHGAGAAPRSTKATPAVEAAAPPAYHQTGAPALPARKEPPAPPAPAKPVLAHARALYQYAGTDPRDLNFERDDKIAVHEYMNADWWMGSNVRTGSEGIFPRNYVQPEEKQIWPPPAGAPPAGPHMMHHQGPQAPVNPYNSHVPPMAVAGGSSGKDGGSSDGGGPSKMKQHGNKFGKK